HGGGHARAFGTADHLVAGHRRAADAHATASLEGAEVGPSLAVEQDDRLAVAPPAACAALVVGGRCRHAAGPEWARARLVSTSTTSLQKAHTSPHAGIPHRVHVRGALAASAACAARAGGPVRRNSRTNASLVPGLAASRRLRASLYTSCVAPAAFGHSSTM